LIEHLEDIKNLGVSDVRLDFTMESGKEMERVLSCYTSYLRGKKEKSNCVENYTKGHFKRGIE
jgi:putative protease